MDIDVKVQAEFLAAILQDAKLVSRDVYTLVEPGYFSVDSYQWLVKELIKRDWKPFPFDFVDQLLLDSVKEESTRENYRTQLYYLYAKELEFVEEAEKKFKTFVSYSIIKSVIKEGFEGFEKTSRIDYLLQSFNEGYAKAKSLVTEQKVELVDYADRYEERMQERLAERDNPSVNPRVYTGIPGLDEQFQIQGPMLVDFLAPFKRYKSIVLNSMGFAALLQGFNVFHIVYENTIKLQENRYDALFGNINYNRISSLAISQDEKDQLDRKFYQLKNWGARLKLFKCQPQQTTIPEVIEHLELIKYREGFVPDVIVLDYLNIVAPSVKVNEERLQQQKIVWDIKSLADKYNIPVFTASQAKMEANKVERMDVTHRGKSIDISQGINLSIALDQSEEEKEEGILVMSPLFSREGDITIPEIVCETDLSKMVVCYSHYEMWKFAERVHGYIPE